jgi:putative nucleotidyltransferase with HDIG domain
MDQPVSKLRTKKSRSREKQANRAATRPPLREHPVIGLLIAASLWLASVLVLVIGHILQKQWPANQLLLLAGDSSLLLVSLLAVGIYMQIVRPDILKQNSRLLALALICLIPLVIGRGLIYFAESGVLLPLGTTIFLLPFALPPLLATILFGGSLGIAVGTWSTLAFAIMSGRSFTVVMAGVITTVVTSSIARNVRTRSKVVRKGMIIGVAQIACVFAATALKDMPLDITVVIHQAGACVLSGVLSAIAALLILPAFEAMFHITTDITLLELSDLGHPLLQRLAIEAPGTYHHSLVVSNLARAAADAIGANSLLARVCSYFHDIGKLTKPEFFAENQIRRINPHDDLPPSMSTLIITAHVKEGLSLAVLHKLPEPVVQVIREHHGTSLLSCFHHKAKSQLEFELGQGQSGSGVSPQKLIEGDFRYTGPRPTSRESAIICIADAVEAASRSLEKVTPANIRGMVDDIVLQRIEDGQLDGSSITFSELVEVKKALTFTLTNMLHGRVPYPTNNENSGNEQSKDSSSKDAVDQKTDGVPDKHRQQPAPRQAVG